MGLTEKGEVVLLLFCITNVRRLTSRKLKKNEPSPSSVQPISKIQMNSVLSIFIGPHSQKLAYFLYHLEAEQIYDEEDDPIDHSVLFRNVGEHLPRALIYDLKNNITALEHINSSNNRKVLEKLEQQPLQFSLGYSDLQGHIDQQLKGVQPAKQLEEEQLNPIVKVFDNFHLLKSQCVEVNKYHADPQWVMYHAGMGINDTPEKSDTYTQPFRKQLEQEDYMDGFVMWADAFCGYGVFTERMLDLLHDECPKKPVMLNCLSDSQEVDKYSQKEQQFYQMNEFMVYGELRQRADIFLPFDIRPQLNYFVSKDEFNVYRSAAPLASNLYTPFSYKKAMRFSNYVQSLRPFGWNNLFNAAYTVPLIEHDQPQKGYSMVDYADIRMPSDLNYLRPMAEGPVKQLRYESFAQSYVLRGPIDLSQFKPYTHSLDMKVMDNLFANRPGQPVDFAEHYVKLYGKEATSFPFHSVLFSHELLKHDIKRIVSAPQRCSSSVMTSFLKMGIERDSFKQLRQTLLELYDSYDKNGRQADDQPFE